MVIFSYILYYLVLIPVSLLPFRVLYILSDFLYLVLYRIFGYRKKVVFGNISRSFPDKSKEEQQRIMDAFYHHLCDLIVESIKIFSISEEDARKRMVCKNPEVMNRYYDEGRSVIVAGGHFNNWELFAVIVHKYIKHRAVGIYQPLNNKFFNDKMQHSRVKYGLELLSTKKVKSFFEAEKGSLTAITFGIDQSPGSIKSCYWMNFLNQDTAVSFGTEKFAVEYNYPVIFCRLTKLKRGHYMMDFEEICENPSQTVYGFITEAATKMLEQDIIHNPPYWLWSHKRWKKQRTKVTVDTADHVSDI